MEKLAVLVGANCRNALSVRVFLLIRPSFRSFVPGQISQASSAATPAEARGVRTAADAEWYFWTVEVEDTDNYAFMVDPEPAVTHIEDDEWRFVAESRTETQTIFPHIEVEAFSYPWFTSYLSGHVNYTGGYSTRYGTSTDSTAFAQGQSEAMLTRASGGDNAAAHNGGYEFSCRSQTGVIWVSNTVNRGHKQDGPLAVYTNATYTISELDDAEKNINVYLPTTFLAGGEITDSGTAGGTVGNKSTKGTLGITSAVTYEGGDEHLLNGNFNLRCRRGE